MPLLSGRLEELDVEIWIISLGVLWVVDWNKEKSQEELVQQRAKKNRKLLL